MNLMVDNKKLYLIGVCSLLLTYQSTKSIINQLQGHVALRGSFVSLNSVILMVCFMSIQCTSLCNRPYIGYLPILIID